MRKNDWVISSKRLRERVGDYTGDVLMEVGTKDG